MSVSDIVQVAYTATNRRGEYGVVIQDTGDLLTVRFGRGQASFIRRDLELIVPAATS